MYEFSALRRLVYPDAIMITADAKHWLRVDVDADDALIDDLVLAVGLRMEENMSRALLEQEWAVAFDSFPSGSIIDIPRPPLISIESFQYTLEDGTVEAVDSDIYVVDTNSEPGRIALKSDEQWPTDDLIPIGGVVINFKAGYGATADAIPDDLMRAFRGILTAFYDERTPKPEFHKDVSLPWTIQSVLSTYRIRQAG